MIAPLEATTETVVVYGTVVPVRESQLSFQRGGTVEEIRKVAGEKVVQADVIAVLDQSELDKQRQQLQASLEQSKRRLRAATRETTASIQQSISQLEGQLRGVEAALERGVIVAPFNGVISEVKLQQGQIAAPETPVIVIVGDEPPRISASLAQKMAARMLAQKTTWAGIGDRAVELKVESSSDIRGRVLGTNIVFEIQSELANDAWEYGDVVELRFRENLDTAGCWLPISALQRRAGDSWFVFTVQPSDSGSGTESFVVKRQPVTIQLLQNKRAYVDGELNSGAMVVVDGTHRIVNGQSVTPVRNAEQPIGPIQRGAGE